MHMHSHHRHGRTVTIGGNAGAIINIVVMFFVGMLLTGMGVVFVFIAETVPILHTSFWLTGSILAFVGVLMFGIGIAMAFRRANAQRLKANGVPGQAQITGLNQTSLYVNNQPVVELQMTVTTQMHPPYTLVRRETIPLLMMGRLTNGQPLPVMVDPANPQNIVIVWEQALSFAG